MDATSHKLLVLRRALWLEHLTVRWNAVGAAVAVAAGVAAGSVALLGFGLDNLVECASGAVFLWRLSAEQRGVSPDTARPLDRRAHRLVALMLLALAVYVMADAVWTLSSHRRPTPSAVGIDLTVVSAVVMYFLSRAKRRAARALGTDALAADSFQSYACMWPSLVTLAGIALNGALGWWWADPAAALGLGCYIGNEGVEVWASVQRRVTRAQVTSNEHLRGHRLPSSGAGGVRGGGVQDGGGSGLRGFGDRDRELDRA